MQTAVSLGCRLVSADSACLPYWEADHQAVLRSTANWGQYTPRDVGEPGTLERRIFLQVRSAAACVLHQYIGSSKCGAPLA